MKLQFIVDNHKNRFRQPNWQEKTGDFLKRFCRVVDKTSKLVETLLPQSPEYTISYGIIVLLFKVSPSDRVMKNSHSTSCN